MATNVHYNPDTHPPSDQVGKPGLYSGNGYGKPSSRPVLVSAHSVASNYSAQHPRPPPIEPDTQLLSKPEHDAEQPETPKKPSTWRRVLRIWKLATQIISTLLSIYMFVSMAYMVAKYQATDNTVRGGRTPWPQNAKLWPTFLLLAAAGVTLILSIATLLSYCCCFKRATKSWKLTVVKYVIHLGVWLVVSALYRYAKGTNGNNNDLWGWSCSEESDKLQAQFNGVVNFSPLCTLQVR